MSLSVVQTVLLLAVMVVEWREVLSICPPRCVCMKLKLTARCTNVKVVPYILDPKTKRLELANNQIKNIYDALTHYYNLEFLDLSYNSIDSLGKSTFMMQKKLRTMKLNWNIITSLDNDSFVGLQSLEVLELKGNMLDELMAYSFTHLPSLQTLDLSHNTIKDIHSAAFFGLNDLKAIFLGHNKIKQIPLTSFPKLKSLVKLDLGHNPLHVVPQNSFAALSSLQKLYLNDCGLRNLGRSSFRGLISLTQLHLDENPFNEIPADAHLELPSLQKLFIGAGSSIVKIKSHTFSRFGQLKELVIHSAPELQTIEKSAFADIPRLEKISISFNGKLRTLSVGVFQNINSLKHVNLRGNALESLDADLLPWTSLDYFDVRDNNFRCDCDLLWLRDLLDVVDSYKNSSVVERTPSDVECGQPADLDGRLVSDLDESDFNCSLPANVQLAIVLIVSLMGVMFIVLFVLAIIYREKVSNYVKDSWSGRKKGSRNVQYQKTSNEEETIYRAANGSMKLTPVTEL